MRTLAICGFAIALLGVAILTSLGDTTNSVPLIPPGVTNLFSTNAQAALRPQVYQAVPYSCIVIVPKPVDTAALISPRSTNQFAIRTIEPHPPLRLELLK
jgi:hypothetical protein